MEDYIPECFSLGLPPNFPLQSLHNTAVHSWNQARPNETVSLTDSLCISRQVLSTTAKSEMGVSELNSSAVTYCKMCFRSEEPRVNVPV
jgi:hypothetical protein